jgi:hypothetical protein
MSTVIATSSAAAGPGHAVPCADGAHLLWCDLVAQIGCEMEETVDTVIGQMRALLSAGTLDRQSALDLRLSLRRAKQISTNSRHIAHLAGRTGRAAAEPVAVADVIRDAIADRAADIHACGVSVARSLPGVEATADRALVTTLAHAVITWALEQASGQVTLALEPSAASARLVCRFRHRRSAGRRSRFGGPATWGSSWHLVRHAAQSLQWTMRTGDDDEHTWLGLEFASRPTRELPPFDAIEVAAAPRAQADGVPQRSFVLLVGLPPEMHGEVRDAVRDSGMELAFCAGADEARGRMDARLPRVVVFGGQCPEADVQRLHADARGRAAPMAFIRIEDGTDAFEVSDMARGAVARIGRRGLASSLPVALLLALAAEDSTASA